MTNPPKEITTPPEGYEWTGEYNYARPNVPHAYWSYASGGCWRVMENGTGTTQDMYPILRKVKPPTVMVELSREGAEYWATWANDARGDETIELANACRKALENEND